MNEVGLSRAESFRVELRLVGLVGPPEDEPAQGEDQIFQTISVGVMLRF